jgi:HD superfamily phosphohydrolase
MSNTNNKLSIVQEWLPQDAELLPFYEGISKFVDSHLSNATDQTDYSSKTIHIPLTGDVFLESWEVAIVDSKLYQRIRDIKQVGLAYLVFPSIIHSRFEHSLGVLGRLTEILNKVTINTNRYDADLKIKEKIDQYKIPIRLAALIHDIGHCVFSHVSERVINTLPGNESYPSSKTIRELFSKHFKKNSQIPFAEIFSISLLGSARFLEFFESLDVPRTRKKDMKSYLENCARFILGLPIVDDPESVFLSQLISSGLDADKIDYMTREAHYADIILGIDLDRIYSKIQIFELSRYSLPRNLHFLKKDFPSDSRYWVLGFDKGGQYAFEEFCIARLSLYVKIYLHQKVRAAEIQLTKYLKQISNSNKYKCAHEWLNLKESFIEVEETEPNLFNINSPFDYVNIKLSKIKHRELYQRAFGFGHMNSLTENISTSIKDNIEILDSKSLKISEEIRSAEEEYLDLIYDEYKIICGLLDIPVANIRDEIIIDIPRGTNVQQGHESLYFFRPAIMPLRWTIPINRIVLYYELNRALAYVFCPANFCVYIFIASEKVIFEKTKSVYLPDGVISNYILNQVNNLKNDLSEIGYYSKLPDLKPKSKYLLSAEAAEKIHSINERLLKFSSYKSDTINIDRITTFLNQFPVNLQAVGLDFLEHLNIYDEHILIDFLKKEIDAIKIKKPGVEIGLSPLGGILDSAAHLMYSLREIINEQNVSYNILNDDLVLKSECLVIFDDNINSGLQLINIIAEWLDVKSKLPPEVFLNEKHVSPLVTEEAKTKLKNIPLIFVYTIGLDDAEEKVKEMLSANKLVNSPDNIQIHIHTVFKKEERIFSGANSKFQHADKNELRNYLIDVSTELLRNENKTEENIKNRVLGYANSEAMAIFPYNVPTMTVTPLWFKGKYFDNDWYPLAERRRRNDKGELSGEDK